MLLKHILTSKIEKITKYKAKYNYIEGINTFHEWFKTIIRSSMFEETKIIVNILKYFIYNSFKFCLQL